jgi:hypothetical protein
MEIWFHPDARSEFEALDPRERRAMTNALEKLSLLGREITYPHASKVAGSDRLWGLRPRAGRSRTRAFYRPVEEGIVVAAFGPEFNSHHRGFRHAVALAQQRLDAGDAG